MISFDRPELSPCLTSLENDPAKHAEALAIIRRGQQQLQTQPRADMPGFVPWERDLRRQALMEKYRVVEQETCKAIRGGDL